MKTYIKPTIISEKSFETSALACGKSATAPAGSHHFTSAYDTFTGHLGPFLGTQESQTGAVGISYGPDSSLSYGYFGLCSHWVTMT